MAMCMILSTVYGVTMYSESESLPSEIDQLELDFPVTPPTSVPGTTRQKRTPRRRTLPAKLKDSVCTALEQIDPTSE